MICLLEESLQTLSKCLLHWKRKVIGIPEYINPGKTDYVMRKLDSCYDQIQLNYELERNQCISFIDVSIMRLKIENLHKTLFRKETRQVQIFISIKTRMQWKKEKLKTLVKRSILICSNQYLLQIELGNI